MAKKAAKTATKRGRPSLPDDAKSKQHTISFPPDVYARYLSYAEKARRASFADWVRVSLERAEEAGKLEGQ